MWQQVDYQPVEGIGGGGNPLSVGEKNVANSINWLFEDGKAFTRPTLNDEGAFGKSAKIDFVKRLFSTGVNTGYELAIDDTGAIHTTAGTLTGAGTTFGNRTLHNIALVNGAFLLGNNVGGLVRNVRDATTYTVQSAAKYRYVTGHLSRAIAAFDITSGSNDEKKVAWSVPGDEDDWTGAGSGSSVLADIPDEITGVATIDNVWVILRARGIHLGFPTGSNTQGPFQFKNYISNGPGCNHPQSLAVYNNEMFFLGFENAYRYRLGESPRPIAPTSIRKALMEDHSRGFNFQGFIALVDNDKELFSRNAPRKRYHLFGIPASGVSGIGLQQVQQRHYSYDIDGETWAKHTYPFPVRTAHWRQFASAGEVELIQDDIDGTRHIWAMRYGEDTAHQGLNLPAILEGRIITVGELSKDYQLSKVLLSFRVLAPRNSSERFEPAALTLKVRCQRGRETVAEEVVLQLGRLMQEGSGGGGEEWRLAWADIRLTGQQFQYIIEAPPSLVIEIDHIVGMFSEHARSKGVQ